MRSSAACILLGATCALAAPGIANLTCPSGETYGVTTLDTSVPASFAQVQTVIGVFNESDWQGLPQTGSAGPANAVGASRLVAFGPLTLNESLIYINVEANSSESVWTLVNGPIPASAAFNISGYQEDLVVNATSANATHFSWTVEYCFAGMANYTSTVAGLFVAAHTGGVANISAILGVSSASNATATSAAPSSAASTAKASSATVASASPAATSAKSAAGFTRASAGAVLGGLLSVAGLLVLA